MNIDPTEFRSLVVRRFEAVQRIALLNSRQLHLHQLLCGLELEASDLARGLPEASKLERPDDPEQRRRTTEDRLQETEAELSQWHEQLDAVDRQISELREHEMAGRKET